jgi:sigma-B regulation protein RsbU (phosphoserine phosphatase)
MMRFPNAQGAICLLVDDGFDCTSTTPGFNHERNKECLHTAAIRIFGNGNLEPVCIKNRSTDKRLRTVKWTGIDKLNCYIAIPLIIDNTCRALLQVLTLEEHEAIFTAEQSILTTLAAHASICLSNAINYQQRTEKARLDGELDAARSIQHRFTPQQRPDIPNVGLKGVYLPAYKVGGDYLDYFKTERGDWVVVIADVCGKGIPAALLMTTMRSAFRIQAETETSAKALLCAVNKFMTFNIDERSFVTALCLIISRDGTHMSYARAGHLLLVKLPHEGGAPQNIACKGIALGLMQDVEMFADVMEEKNIPLISGDRYLLYTDGLIEAVNPQNKSYGYGRLHTLLTHDTTSNPEQLIDKIITDIRTFTNGAPDHDDLTLLSFRVL